MQHESNQNCIEVADNTLRDLLKFKLEKHLFLKKNNS